MSVKKVSESNVTGALVSAAGAWADAEVAYLNARLNLRVNDRRTKRTILLGADTVTKRRNGFGEAMGLGLQRVFASEYRRAKNARSRLPSLSAE